MSDTSHNGEAQPKRDRSTGGIASRVRAVIYQAVMHVYVDNGMMWAASIAYYSLLSLFPLLLLAASVGAAIVDQDWAIDQAIQLMGEFLPVGEGEIASITREAIEARGTVGLLSFGALLWTGTRVFSAMTIALNIAYNVEDHYSFLKSTLIELVMLLTVGIIFFAALVTPFILDLLYDVLEILPVGRGVIPAFVRGIVPFALLTLSFFLIYRFVPRRQQNWRSALSGAVVASVLFMIARPLFIYYVEQFGNYNLIYGSIAIIVILLFWAWIVSVILLFGGEIAAHVQALIIEEQPAEVVEQAHQLRAEAMNKVPDLPRASTPSADTKPH